MVYPYNRILFSHKEEQSTDNCYNMNEPWKHYAKWKTADTKEHAVWLYLHEIPRIGKPGERKCRIIIA